MAAEHENLVIAASAPEAVKAAVLSDRVDAEKRNVEVDCWLYHTRKEDDHDFHLILGSTATEAIATAYLTAEVSGLPEGGKDVDKLKAACRQFNDLCKQHLSQDKLDDIKDKYLDFTPPLRVRVRGSLFFDGQHKPGTIGPGKHKPKKAWEIHPMISIEAL
jgi:hypothetical protein